MPTFDFTKKKVNNKTIGGTYTGKVGRPKGCKLLHKVDRSNSNQARFGYRRVTTSRNKIKDTPIKHGYHLEDYNRLCVYAHYYGEETKPFYIGCGTLQRAFVLKGTRRHKEYNAKAKDINLIKVDIIAINIDKNTAYDIEEENIKKYGIISEGGCLVNISKYKTGGSRGTWGNNHNSKPVLQFSKSGKFIKEWSCATEAGFRLLIDSSAIAKCCRKRPRYNSAGGYIWKYKEIGD